MKRTLLTGSKAAFFLFIAFIICSVNPSAAWAQDEERSPDDSLLIEEYIIDSIPEHKDIDHIEESIRRFLKDRGYRYDVFEAEGGRSILTFKEDVSKQLRFYDRDVEMILFFEINEAREVTMKVFAREKIKSIKKDYWRITGDRSRERLLNLSRSYFKTLNKKLTYKR